MPLSVSGIRRTVVITSFILINSSCDRNRIYDRNYSLANSIWFQEDVKEFSFNISDTTLRYRMLINVRNTSEYAFSNLYLFIEMSTGKDKYFMDTVQFILADKSGKWTGNGIGNIWQNQLDYMKVKLQDTGMYLVRIGQGMRSDELDGISDIGFRIEKI